MSNYKHWKVETDNEKILWLGLDRQDETVNSINDEVLDELNNILLDIAQKSELKGLVIHSCKTKGFIAGADIKSFVDLTNPSKVVTFLRKGQSVFTRLENLSIPTVAMINGFCLGGGFELALACNYRIAVQDARIGLPEVMLGIHPGWGGSVRLPKLIGGFKAIAEVILPGAPLRAKKAKKLGMIDDAVPLRQLKRAAVYYIHNKPPQHKPGITESLTNTQWVRKIASYFMRKRVAKQYPKAHYPAPYAIIDLWEKEGGFEERAYLKEIDSIERLVTQNETASNLIRLFFLSERLKGFAKQSQFKAKHVHVIGAGIMGGDIAAYCALQGLRVTLQDQDYERVAKAITRAHQLFKKRLKEPRRIQAALDNLVVDIAGHGVSRADVIIEAVFESLEVKHAVFKNVEAHAKPTAIIATNTSSIPLDEISQCMQNPTRLVGIHFFNPASVMKLVEVVKSTQTSSEIVDAACSFVNQIGKYPLPVQSSPGFLINRVLMPYLMECVQLLEEGVSAEVIDHAARQFGMVMGPVELADTVGMDVCLAVAKNLTSHFGGEVPRSLIDLVNAGKLGKKTGEGFYRYKNGKPVKQQNPSKMEISREKSTEIANRLILRMVNEACACLREKVVEDADLLDAGMVLGTGFAPFRGGPMHYANTIGKENLNQLFSQLESRHGQRFRHAKSS